jgi:DNA-binding CsgD family transcriptional regulator
LIAIKNILSNREIQLLDLISQGYSTKGCAESMFISIRTVETQRKNMLRKLEAKSTPHLVAICKDIGLI